ncbi:MAG: glycosyltransferase, partial [Deltaproteobacteria bacterium]|nr:glycosyltransferase [Deltaproteobacteria bacterium]
MKVIIAGGGTGGHLFPAVALAEAFENTARDTQLLFVGTRNPLEVSSLSKRGYAHAGIDVEGLKGRSVGSQLRALAKISK